VFLPGAVLVRVVGSLKFYVSFAKEPYKRNLYKISGLTLEYFCPALMEVAASARNPNALVMRGGGLGSRPKKMYGERLGDGVEYYLMKPTPCR